MRRVMLALVGLGCFTLVEGASADWLDRMKLDWHRMNRWPEPHVHADREVVRSPLMLMVNNGWRLQNTLSDHLFDPVTQTLTQAGRLKVRWITTQAPPNRRTVYVLRGETDEATQTRLAAVQEHLAGLHPRGVKPQVAITDIVPPGGSGDYFNEVDLQLKKSIPEPRLPEREIISGTGG